MADIKYDPVPHDHEAFLAKAESAKALVKHTINLKRNISLY